MPVAEIEKTVGKMCELLRHGGPDDGGIFTSAPEHLVLGNRRLSLLDLSAAGHQPMQYGDGRYTITYNGELYNFKELKNELKGAGMQFNNHTDTEVILAAFAKWNTQSFSRLNGMFAFALWDSIERSLYLVRDAAGIKPLYYSASGGGITFSSEMRAFAPVTYLREKAETSIYQLAYGFVPDPLTTLADVRQLSKGCWLKYDSRKSSCSLQVFSFFSYGSRISNTEDARNETADVVSKAVQRQMVADAPVGVFLSGGVDSAIIAALAERTKTKDLHTLSIHFTEEKYSEKKYQDILAAKLKSEHHSFQLHEDEFHKQFPSFLSAMDMPSCDGINTWFISKFAAAEGLKAVLSGIGADELYGGYPSFRRMDKTLMLQRSPNMLLGLARKANNKYSRISYLRINGIRGLYLFLRGLFSPAEIAAHVGGYEKEVWTILAGLPAGRLPDNLGPGNIASRMEFLLYMQDQLLRDADIMSMAHGLEIRVPFLDDEVIRSAFAIAEKTKYGNRPKELLISAFHDDIPNEIWNRKKMGFSFPFAEWLKNSEYVKRLSQNVNPRTRKACTDFYAGKLHWSRIMALIVLNRES